MNVLNVLDNEEFSSRVAAIEEKLYERGFLVSAIGDSEAEVQIGYEMYEEDGEEGPYVVIRIVSEDVQYEDEEKFEEISDFVNEKLNDALDGMPEDLRNAAYDVYGQVVLLNGRKVY